MSRGSIDQIRSGAWRLRIYVNGKQETMGFYATEAEAEMARAGHMVALAESASDYEGLTVAELGKKVLTRREVKGTVRDPESDWSRFTEHVKNDRIGKMAVRAVQSSHVFSWLDRLEDKGLAGQTRRNCLSLLRTIFRAAHKAGQVKQNPCIGVRVEGKDRDCWTYLTRDELPKVLEASETVEGRHIVAVAIGTGVRPGELVTLRRADVHLDDRPRIVVRYGAAPDVETKTGAVRTVHLFGLSLVAMRSWMSMPEPEKNPHGLVFPRERGGFRDENHVIKWEAWKALLLRAGITRRFRWYDFRHTCASWLVSGWWGRRWSLEEVREMLGHTSITITQRYAHLAESASEEAARLTVGQVNVSHRFEPVYAPSYVVEVQEKPETTDSRPRQDSNLRTFGLGIQGFIESGAEISSGDSLLTCQAVEGSDDAPLLTKSALLSPLLRALAAIHTPCGRGGLETLRQ